VTRLKTPICFLSVLLPGICLVAVGCGSAANQKPPAKAKSLAAQVAQSPDDILSSLKTRMQLDAVKTAYVATPPSGFAGSNWLYVEVSYNRSFDGVLSSFQAMLLVDGYQQSAASTDRVEGWSYYNDTATACVMDATDPECEAPATAIPDPVKFEVNTDSSGMAKDDLASRLREMELIPIAITVIDTGYGNVPVILAQTTDANSFVSKYGTGVPSLFGSLPRYESAYLRVVDQDGNTVSAFGQDANLATSFAWMPVELRRICCGE
jgi:hypothetical protein